MTSYKKSFPRMTFRWKGITCNNAFGLLIVIFLMFPIFSITPVCSENKITDNLYSDFFRIAQNEELPNASVSLSLVGISFGNQIEANLTFGFRYDISTMSQSIGFHQEYLKIINSPMFVRATGLGYDEMREYPFVYTDSGMLTDYWLNHTPNWVSRRNYSAWSDTSKSGGYLGPITEENITHITHAGDIVEFENLTIYFEDGTSFLCGPRIITVGVNFTQRAGDWSVEYLLQTSESQNIVIHESGMTINLPFSDPISIPFFGITIGIVIVSVLIYREYKRRFPRTVDNKSGIDLS